MGARTLNKAYELLFEAFGPQRWWPGETPFEIAVGAILTQNTSWKNVERAIANLKSNTPFTAKSILNMSDEELSKLIRPAGYFRLKTRRLKNFLRMLVENYNGDILAMKQLNTTTARRQLLSVSGIGPETADSILLYALEKPSFVVDTYTYRMLSRHGLCDEQTTYEDLQRLFMDNLAEDVKLYNEFHALIVKLGKEFCRPKPVCNNCPLKEWINGPIF